MKRSRSPGSGSGSGRSRAEKLKDFARKKLENAAVRLHHDTTKVTVAALSAPKPSSELLKAINDSSRASFGEEYRKSVASSMQLPRDVARQKTSLSSFAAASSSSIQVNATSNRKDDDMCMNLKVGDRVVVRSASASGGQVRGRIRAVVHGGYTSAKYDVIIAISRGVESNSMMVGWRDVILDEQSQFLGRDRDSNSQLSTGNGVTTDAFGRTIPADRLPLNNKSREANHHAHYGGERATEIRNTSGRVDILGDFDAINHWPPASQSTDSNEHVAKTNSADSRSIKYSNRYVSEASHDGGYSYSDSVKSRSIPDNIGVPASASGRANGDVSTVGTSNLNSSTVDTYSIAAATKCSTPGDQTEGICGSIINDLALKKSGGWRKKTIA